MEKNLDSLINEDELDRLIKWCDKLPLPLSSLLFELFEESDYEKKIKHLINFFEAFSEFNATIILSLIYNNKFNVDDFSRCLNHKKNHKWLHRPNFGYWVFLNRCLTFIIRNYFDPKVFDISDKFLESIYNKQIHDIFLDAVRVRNELSLNRFRDETEINVIFKYLFELLSKIFLFSSFFEDLSLIQVEGKSTCSNGVYSTPVKELTGRPPFIDYKLDTKYSLNEKKLYLIQNENKKSIELLPLIVNDSSRKNNFYFFNGYQEKSSQKIEFIFISYNDNVKLSLPQQHFETMISMIDFFSTHMKEKNQIK